MKQTKQLWIAGSALTVLILSIAYITSGQLIDSDTSKRRAKTGNYFSAQRPHMPPLPFNPFPDLPVYEFASGQYLYDDREVDYAKLWAEAAERAALMKSQDPSGGSGFLMEGGDNPSGLRLKGPVLDGTNLALSIEGGETNGIYDLYWNSAVGTTNVVGTSNAWTHLYRTGEGQTSLWLTPGISPSGFFVLGTQQDSDGDTLPDAYEAVVLQTDPYAATTAAALGTNAGLLTDVPSSVRTSEMLESLSYRERWDACPCPGDTSTSEGIVQWKRGAGGTHIWTDCDIVCTTNGSWMACSSMTNAWNGEGPWWKFAWHLETNWIGWGSGRYDASGYAKIELATGGPRLSVKQWPFLIFGSARELLPVWGDPDPEQLGQLVSPTNISVGGTKLNASGEGVAILRDNTTNDFTPVVTGTPSNYVFYVTASKVKVPLVFRNSGSLTPRETTNAQGQIFGYQADIYDALTNIFGRSTLGTGGGPGSDGAFHNIEETSAHVPTNGFFNAGWNWHRDVQDKAWLWNPSNGLNIGVYTWTNFSGTPGEVQGNDTGGGAADESPDSARLILTSDGPSPGTVGLFSAAEAPPGSVVAHRMYAREWLTWNGTLASGILRWRSFLTLRRKPDLSWERVGQNLIAEMPEGSSEVPVFTVEELLQILAQ